MNARSRIVDDPHGVAKKVTSEHQAGDEEDRLRRRTRATTEVVIHRALHQTRDFAAHHKADGVLSQAFVVTRCKRVRVKVTRGLVTGTSQLKIEIFRDRIGASGCDGVGTSASGTTKSKRPT
jgi:hypothetical protein